MISVLRGLAAVAVTAAHLRADLYPGLRTLADPALWYQGFSFLTGFGHQAVLVFFVISGWLVGGSLLNKLHQPGVLTNYAIDRMTRLWTVLIPTLGLTVLFGIATGTLDPGRADFSAANEFSAVSFVGNLLGLQRVVLENFGGNYALWSLANETWYYVMFPLLVLLFRARNLGVRITCGAMLMLATAFLTAEIMMYFAIWLLGVAFSRVRIDCGAKTRYGCVILLFSVFTYSRMSGNQNTFDASMLAIDLVCSGLLLIVLSSLQFTPPRESYVVQQLTRVGKFFSDFSFSLYALHVPLIILIRHIASTQFSLPQLSPREPLHFVIYLVTLVTIIGTSYLFYLLFESKTYRIRRMVKDLVEQGSALPDDATASAPQKRQLK
jgi:peptidoglycan/LPS O-acetylase OafA/YrhL